MVSAPDPASLSPEQFLKGPGNSGTSLVVDPIFEKAWEQALEDWSADTFGNAGKIEETCAMTLMARLEPTWRGGVLFVTAVEPATGVAAVLQGKIIGLYVGSDLVVSPAHRGRGIGHDLVIERYDRFGELPAWGHDKPSYSPAGAATHLHDFKKACEIARDTSPPSTVDFDDRGFWNHQIKTIETAQTAIAALGGRTEELTPEQLRVVDQIVKMNQASNCSISDATPEP